MSTIVNFEAQILANETENIEDALAKIRDGKIKLIRVVQPLSGGRWVLIFQGEDVK